MSKLAMKTGLLIAVIVILALASAATSAYFEGLVNRRAQQSAAYAIADGERALMLASANVTEMLGNEAAQSIARDREEAHPRYAPVVIGAAALAVVLWREYVTRKEIKELKEKLDGVKCSAS